ncbi:MAG: Pesticin receptor [Steroidobacteraceae bacterium]|nr:Pesticin receptor [Steroidobacteraceae bacterium]
MAAFSRRTKAGRSQAGRSAFLVAGAALAATGLHIQVADAADAASNQIEEVIVTASRRAESVQDTALSVTSIDPQTFATGGLTTLEDVINYSPGVYFRGGSAPTDNGITMRGVSTFTSAPTVGVYIDDVPIGSGNGQASGASLMLDVMKAGMERVEMIKGPQGTLYGASSMGGLIRYVSPDPSKATFGGAVSADLSTISHGDSGQRYTGRVSVPIVADRFGVSFSGYYEDIGGFIDRIPAAASGAAKNVNGYENYGGMVKLAGNFTDRFSASLLGLRDKTTFHGRNIVALSGPPFVPANGPYETDTSKSLDDSKFSLVAGTLNYEFDFANLISSTSYQERLVTSTTDLVADFGPLVELFCGCTVDNAPFTGAQSTDRFVQEVRLVSREKPREAGNIDWSIGAIYSKEESGNGQRLAGLPTNFVLLDVNVPSILKETAGFGNLTYYITPQFDLTAGVRVAKVKASVAVDDGPEILLPDTPPTEIDDTVDTYSFSARYRPSGSLSLYARAASGYRPAAANLPLRDVNGNNVAPVIVEADTLWSYEVGAKGYFGDGRFTYDTAAWWLHWKNLQARIYVNGAMTGGNANSDVTAYGFEGMLGYSPGERFNVTASLAYTHSTLDDDETTAFGAVSGENLPGIPQWTWAVRGKRTVPLASGAELSIGLGFRYTDQQDTGFEGGTGANGAVITPLIYNFVIDKNVIADLNVGWQRGNVSFSLYGTNIFDEYGYSSGTARPAVGFIRATASVIQPRTFGAILQYKF